MINETASQKTYLRCIITTPSMDTDLARYVAVLDMEESEKLHGFVVAEDRRDYAIAHALLRQMLTALEPDIPPKEWRFERTTLGKPYLPLIRTGAPPIYFSLSHTRGLVACAISRDVEVGVDVECDTRTLDVRSVMSGVCSIDEQQQIHALGSSAQEKSFLDFWTLKEAYAKGHGAGLRIALDQISFDLRTPGFISASLPDETADGWWFALIRQSQKSRIGIAIATVDRRPPILDAALINSDGSQTPMYPIRTSAPSIFPSS